MYIKLGNIKVNRTKTIDDFMIFVEVVDSKMSFEEPVIVRNPSELDIWFGKSFTDRDYLIELLESGVSLYLYRPVSTKSNYSNFIDIESESLHEYEEEVIFYKFSELPSVGEADKKYNLNGIYYVYLDGIGWVELSRISDYVERPKDNYTPFTQPKQFATKDTLPETGLEDVKYRVLEDGGSWFLWLHESWVDEKNLPQNLENESESLSNRDVLALTAPDETNAPEYLYPEYNNEQEKLGYYQPSISVTTMPREVPAMDDLVSGRFTFAQRVKQLGELGNGYCRVSNPSTDASNVKGGKLLYRGVSDKTMNEINDYYNSKSLVSNFQDARDGFSSWYSRLDLGGDEFLAYNTLAPVRFRNFNTIPNLSVAPDIKANYNITTTLYLNKAEVFMWSKTIGTDEDQYDDDKNIKVQIEETDYLTYRFTITRYGYTEIYEGSLFPEPGEERIDDKISRASKLIRCEINLSDEAIKAIGRGERKGIREGEFTLRGARCEDYSKENYWKSLDLMCREEIYPDYILIPNINLFVDDLDPNYSYYKEYKELLDIAKELNCQVLIQNHTYPVKEVDDISNIQERNTIYKVMYEYYGLDSSTGRLKKIKLSDLETILASKLYELVEVDSIETPEAGKIYKIPVTSDFIYYLNGVEEKSQRFKTILEVGSDYRFNYTGDKENRLIYFYSGMEVYGYKRPGYYMYLYGLLTNIFSMTTTEVLYYPPVDYAYDFPYKVVYLDKIPDIMKKDVIYVVEGKYYLNGAEINSEKTISAIKDNIKKESLEEFKSNYPVCNNQIYYYRDYKSGKDFESTAWMRFAVSKIYREIQKNKWKMLSLKSLARIRQNLLAVLNRITANFSLISSINLIKFDPKMENNFLDLTIETNVADLVRENIIIDLNINYYED